MVDIRTDCLFPGLALYLDPGCLLDRKASPSCSHDRCVKGSHYFIYVCDESDYGLWLPTFGDTGFNRRVISPKSKSGHPNWQRRKSYYHLDQLWNASPEAIVAAAVAAGDRSTRFNRNKVSELCVSYLQDLFYGRFHDAD